MTDDKNRGIILVYLYSGVYEMKFQEERKEDKVYYQGAFWIVADSFRDIMRGNFQLVGKLLESDYNGNYTNYSGSQKPLTHQRLWRDEYSKQPFGDGKEYNYYPRGRVAIHNGVAYIHLNSKCNTPKIVDEVVKTYGLDGLEIEIDLNDTYQGSHYEFLLE